VATRENLCKVWQKCRARKTFFFLDGHCFKQGSRVESSLVCGIRRLLLHKSEGAASDIRPLRVDISLIPLAAFWTTPDEATRPLSDDFFEKRDALWHRRCPDGFVVVEETLPVAEATAEMNPHKKCGRSWNGLVFRGAICSRRFFIPHNRHTGERIRFP